MDSPHFALPINLQNGLGVLCNEQDTDDEIMTAAIVCCAFPRGSREEVPGFGLPEQAFRMGGIDPSAIMTTLAEYEPRAQSIINIDESQLDSLIDAAMIGVSGGTEVG